MVFKKTIAVLLGMVLLVSSFAAITASADEAEQIGGALTSVIPSVKAGENLIKTFAAGGKEENMTESVISDAFPQTVGGNLGKFDLLTNHPGLSASSFFSNKNNEEQSFIFTRIWDYDTGCTLGRCYAPENYEVTTCLMYAGDGVSDCSAATPYQLAILATKPEGDATMIYKSKMSYLYPPVNDYVEGQLFMGREMMLYPMTAGEYADYVMVNSAAGAPEIYRVSAAYSTDQEDPYLAEQSKAIKDYIDEGTSGMFNVGCDLVSTTYADVTYQFELEGESMKTRIITMTNVVRYVMYGTIASVSDIETYVPFIYVLAATEDVFDEVEPAFELFVSNTRATDEFDILNTLRSQDLLSILDTGFPKYDNLDEMMPEILGDDYGTYDTDQFCDYILDQNDYTASDGRSFKVPTSYDYVYEGDDGTIYATNSTEQPAGSTRLYAN